MKDEDKTKAKLIKESKTLRKERRESALNDLAEHKQIEEKYPSFTKDILDASTVGVFILDSDFKVVWINHSIEKYFGIQKEKVIGKDKRKLIKKNIQHIFEDSDGFIRRVFATYDNNTYVENFECHVLPDGKRNERWLEHRSQPIKSGLYAGGRIEHYYDITERKKTEETLQESEERYHSLIESTYDLIQSVDLNGRFLFVNKAWRKTLGYTEAEIPTLNLWKIIHPQSLPHCQKTFSQVLKGKLVRNVQATFVTKDGRSILIEGNAIGRYIRGKLVATHGFFRNITERKQAEEALVESEEKYRTVFETTGTATLIIEENAVISMTNTQFEKLSGYSKDEIENKIKLTDLVIPEDLEEMKKYHIARRKTGEKAPNEYEFSLIDKKGNIKNIFLKIGMISGTKKNVASLMDITERMQAEKNVKNAKDELQMIMDSVPALIFYKDTESRIIRVNKTGANSLKMPVKDIIDKTTEELFPKEQAEKMRKSDQEVIISGKPKKDIIQPYTTPDGIRWLTIDKIPYKDKKGKVTGIIGLAKDITVQRKSEQKLQQSYQKLKKTMDATIDTMSKIIEAKDPYTSGHQHRVYQLAVPLAQELGLSKDKVEGIRIASLIHDIGRIGLPTEILNKPGKLNDMEFGLIKGHSQIGYDILKSIDFSYPIARIILQHHERLNGSGYPNNIKGDKILLEARIVGVADVVEAISSHRPYRPALGIDAALKEISKNKGTLYDPEVVDACLKLFKEKEFKFK